MVVILGLPTRGILSEKHFGNLLEVVERMGAAESRTHVFQLDENVRHKSG